MRRLSITLGAAVVVATWGACAFGNGPTDLGDCRLDGVDLFATLTPLLPAVSVRETVAVTPALIQGLGSDCTTEQLEQLELSSDQPGIASVTSNVVTGVSPGVARMRVSLLASVDSFDLEVVPTAATSVVVTPSSRVLGVGETLRFRHVCRDSGDFDTVCPAAVTWSTDPPSSPVASVDRSGLVTANHWEGTVTIRATVGSLVGTAFVTVDGSPNPATSVVVTPSSRRMTVGSSFDFQYVCRDSGNLDTVCPGAATWSTDPPSSPVASVDGDGLVRANAEGTVDIDVTVGALVGTATVTVTPDTPGQLLFQMDLSEGAFPLAGFTGLQDTVANQYSIRRRANAGPGGIPSYVIQPRGSSSNTGPQPYMGWSYDFNGNPALGYGQTVFVRWWFRWTANARCESWNAGARTTQHVSKHHMINDQGGFGGRAIVAVSCEANMPGDPTIDGVSFSTARANGDQRCNSNGAIGNETGKTHVNDTTWVAIQYSITWSSSRDADDASYSLWVDNQNEDSPNCVLNTNTWTASPVVFNATNDYDVFQLGWYWEAIPDLSRGGVYGYELTGYEVGTSFDPTWGNR